jgi:hypothetical protein
MIKYRIFHQALLRATMLGCALLIAAPLTAQEPAAPQSREHVVKRGDTLWDLARTYLRNPFMWPCLWEANKSTLKSGNPNRIYPAENLAVPAVCTTAPAEGPPPPDEPVAAAPAPAEPTGEDRTSFFVTPLRRAAEVVDARSLPRVADLEFYGAAWLGDVASLPVNGRLLRVVAPDRPADRLPEMAHPHDRMYVEHVGPNRPVEGDQLLVLERQRTLKGWGTVIVPSAVVVVDSIAPDVMRVEITKQFGQVLPGFLTMPLPQVPTQALGPLAEVAGGPVGQVVDFLVNESLYGISDVVFVSLGRAVGVELGDELLAYAPRRGGNSEAPVQLPEEPVARMKVIHVSENSSTGRIVSIKHPTIRAGMPVRLARKVP